MTEPKPAHYGKLYNMDDENPFWVVWDEETFYVYMEKLSNCRRSPRGHNTPTPFRGPNFQEGLQLGNCCNCLTCGPVYASCPCCNTFIIPFSVRDPQNMSENLYNVHPILLANEANKPCLLPNNAEEFNIMYLRQEAFPPSTPARPYPLGKSLTPNELTKEIRAAKRNKRISESKTHGMGFAVVERFT